MRRAAACLSVVALACAGSAGGAGIGGTPIALVALPGAAEVAVVDVGSGSVLGRLRVPRGPREVSALQGLTHVLVTSPDAGAVSLIDAVSRRVVQVWRGFGRPTDVAVDGLRAYVTDTARGELVVLEPAGRRIVARIQVGGRPHAVAVGDRAIVAHEGSPRLTLVDLDRRRVVDTIDVGAPVQSLSEQPDTANVYVTFRGSGEVALVDWGRRRILFRRLAASRTSALVKDVYVGGNLWVADRGRGSVLLLSAADGRVRRVLRGCAGAHRLAQVGTASIVAACPGNRSLAVWRTAGGPARLTRLGARPAGVAITVLP